MQTGFMKGRNIVQNIYSLNNIIDHCRGHKIPAVIISIDFEKAFDTIEWSGLQKILRRLNFRQFFINAVMALYNDMCSCVGNNGYWSDWFKLSRGCHQGCCLTPVNYVIVAELLADKIFVNND